MHQRVRHPIIQHKLTVLRDRHTDHKVFRELVNEITMLLAYEALKHVKLADVEIETPLARMVGKRMVNDVVLAPVLRAGVGMLDSVQTLIPTARVGFIGLYRDHDTKQPVEYYVKLPLDPMLATGGSTNAAIDALKARGFPSIVVLALVSAPEGIAAVEARHADVKIYTAAIDEALDANKYIVPGLGDAGDRLYGTQ
jgi:uracil phosphoribosyltransferase